MANTLPFSNMLMKCPLERCCDVVAFLPLLAMMDQRRNPRRFQLPFPSRPPKQHRHFAQHSEQRSRFLLFQRLESSRDQGSGYTKMVLILSNVVKVKIKDILSFDYSLEGIPTAC